ncbi:MAG: helix-turn-helix transcriptional regulator [Flavobacteriaceae bacterium]|nr:helix-turn-helix transcriptional regulator [Flavobacteriaceae bacterium]
MLGAVQGFTLCLYLFRIKRENRAAFWFYLLFLFSLSYFNLIYFLTYMGIETIGDLPISSLPFPYKYLIATGFFMYLDRLILSKDRPKFDLKLLLFVPALAYAILRTYWYVNMHLGGDEQLFYRVYQTGFFNYNEFVYLGFSLILIGYALVRYNKERPKVKGGKKAVQNWDWIIRFTTVYFIFIAVNMGHQIIANLFGLQHKGEFYLILLLLNSLYIYWVGFVSFSKSKLLFPRFELSDSKGAVNTALQLKIEKLEHLMQVEALYTQQELRASDLAEALEMPSNQLSLLLQETYGMTFTEYMNGYRVEKVKELLKSDVLKTYNLAAVYEQAGFRSKSSFNAVFKNVTGQTPTAYLKSLEP